MFIGSPPGNYDRLLDFSKAKTGTLFFVPPATFLDDVGSGAIPIGEADSGITESEHSDDNSSAKPSDDGSLNNRVIKN